MVIVWSFIAGLLIVYGIPYFLTGLKGKEHSSPIGTTAVLNFIYGWLAIAIGIIFLHIAHAPVHPVRDFIFFQLGALIMGLVHASSWHTKPTSHKK